MFKLFIITALIAFAAAVSDDDVHAEATRITNDVRANGFDAVLETTNHIHQASSGNEHGDISGEYSWISPEGVHVVVKYLANENGYQPSSDLLPTPPPVPEYISRAIEYIKAHPSKEESHH